MQKKRPQAPLVPETFQAQSAPPAPAAPGRAKRVRSRLVAGVAVVSLVVIGAGLPGVLAVSAELSESQRLVELAELNRQAVTLAHSLADERDEVTAYIAAGREEQEAGAGDKDRREVTATRSARVDRQIDEITEVIPDGRAELRRELAAVPSVRRDAMTGKGTAVEAHRAYTAVITGLHALAVELADETPSRAPGATAATRAPAALGLAVEQASAARGLLLAALSVPAGETEESLDPISGLPVEQETDESKAADEIRDVLSAAAQQSRVREQAALADFDQAAGKDARESLAATVTGAEVKTAENYLARLTDQPQLSAGDRKSNREKLESSLTARIELMRGIESSLASERIVSFEQLRDDDVTALEIRVGLLGGTLLLTIGALAAIARTLTRPLAVLRIGAARLANAPELEDPVRFTGRNDEFAQVVRSLNALHGKVVELGDRAERLEGDRGELAGSRDAVAAQLSAARAEMRQHTAQLTAELERLRHTVDHTFVNLSLRTLGLVERQLGVIEKLEEREQDPERLATLFKLDHMATVMRRHSENLLVLAGAEHGHSHTGPVPLVDVLRAAVSEIERYERVVIQSLPPHVQVAGFAADDLSHLVAELLENATSFSPPEAQVELSGWLLESGEVMLSVQDGGIGMTPGRLAELNARLADPETFEAAPPVASGRDAEGLGLRVAALLAARHGVRVQLREQAQGGVAAVVVLPQGLLPKASPVEGRGRAGDSGTGFHLPGSVAEANSNALPSSPRQPLPAPPAGPPADPLVDPLVEAAEAAVRAAEPEVHERAADSVPDSHAPDEPTFEMRLPELEQYPVMPGQATPFGSPEPVASVPEPAGEPEPAVAPGPVAGPAPVWDRVTDKGLPKRTPKIVKPAAAPGERTGSVDAEDLRRRLGGFQRAADQGRREAEAQVAQSARKATEEAGDTVEEARS
ncbi:sensor histidine kinase [Streptomyces albipurpureus]|uniref:histidine kinase n=1 Tax=Streptomyces albipurpureus TaxID=2897419 RepID=A0ABT0UL52_9ACTN|nr:nitrate- and nitrite sensing domain-containing protein [Streptomyces sp. CWNU-1]MCM2388001.1 nitrate- and nitrite sensing domain-containing protein [Streptomyces sp. CWNU-1]